MRIVIPDDYEGNFTDSPQLARLMELGEVAHFTGRPVSEEEMAARIADADVILTVRYQTDFMEHLLARRRAGTSLHLGVGHAPPGGGHEARA